MAKRREPDATREIRALVIDDEPLAREGIKRLVQGERDIAVVGEAGDGPEAARLIRAKKPDLVFLDVQMPEADGFEVLDRAGPEHLPAVIFVTAYDRYALRAFEVHAIDYLLKPIDPEKFRRAVHRARSALRLRAGVGVEQRIASLLDEVGGAKKYRQRVIIKSRGRMFILRCTDLDWIEADGDYAVLHARGKKHLLRDKISRLERQLDPERFVRIHRSTIVNVDRISEMQPLSHGEMVVLLNDGNRLVSSRSYRKKLDRLLLGSL